jgi:hypothetical protein
MNASPEQIQIVRTVINEFLPAVENLACAEKVLGIVLKYVEGNANQATTRCEFRDTLAEISRQTDEERLNLCIETACWLAHGYSRWMQGQENADELDIFPALELKQLYQRVEAVVVEITFSFEALQLSIDSLARRMPMKISFIQTDARTLREETERRLDVVFEFSSFQKGAIVRIWKAARDFFFWLFP